MSEIKFTDNNGRKNQQHIPTAVAQDTFVNGQAVVVSYDAKGNAIASLPTADTAKGDVKFIANVIDKPELDNKSDYKIEKGEPCRAFTFQKGVTLDISADLVTDETVAIGDTLVPNTSGTYTVSAETDYEVKLKVIKPTTFMGKGFQVIVE